MCGNILHLYLALPHSIDDHGDRTNQFHWLELLHTCTLCISLLNQAGKGRVCYSVDKCFETRADLGNIFDKKIQKLRRHVCRHFTGVRDFACNFGVEFESSCHRKSFEIGLCAVKKL